MSEQLSHSESFSPIDNELHFRGRRKGPRRFFLLEQKNNKCVFNWSVQAYVFVHVCQQTELGRQARRTALTNVQTLHVSYEESQRFAVESRRKKGEEKTVSVSTPARTHTRSDERTSVCSDRYIVVVVLAAESSSRTRTRDSLSQVFHNSYRDIHTYLHLLYLPEATPVLS